MPKYENKITRLPRMTAYTIYRLARQALVKYSDDIEAVIWATHIIKSYKKMRAKEISNYVARYN